VLRRPLELAQYACGDHIQRLERVGIQPSMSRLGCPWDNAMTESFMRTLKREEVDGRAYRDPGAGNGHEVFGTKPTLFP
jgi:putative transposase